jgi:hypothetical protein
MERRKFVISAALPQADICGAPTHVRFGPIVDMGRLRVFRE